MNGWQTIQQMTLSLPPERSTRIESRKNELPYEMALHELRLAIAASRQDLAGELATLQPSIARMGRRSDILISRLRRLVEGMGGSLEVRAHFPEADIIVTNFKGDNTE
jgi:hypothetical protein